MANEYYPRLSSLLPLDALPESLGFVKNGITSLLGGLYYKDLQYSISRRGDAAQYSLTIVRNKSLEIEVPGTGMFLMLNPGTTSSPHPEFPVTLRYEWGILTFVRAFNPETFSFQPADFYRIALDAVGMTERQLLERALDAFVPGANLLDKVNQFIDDANALYGTTVAHQSGTDPLGTALSLVKAETQLESTMLAFALYIQDVDLSAAEERLEVFFSGFFPGSLKEYFTKLITPRIDATLQVGFGIRFPESMLKPLPDTSGNTPPFSALTFDAGKFSFSTESGIGYDGTLAAKFTPSEIGNSGFKIAFDHALLDLSRKTNIAQATADGRSEEFVGVFIENAKITLPPFFKHDPGASTAEIVGTNLLIGTGGGISGRLALRASDSNATTPALVKAKFGSGFELGLQEVNVTFKQNVITESGLRGFMKIPGFKDVDGNDAEIEITAKVSSNGDFDVTASEDDGIRALRIEDVLEFDVKSLSVGRRSGRFYAALVGTIDFLGVVGEFLADKVEIQKLLIWDNGDIELEGGKITLPRAVSLKVGPVKLSVSAIGFGSYEHEHLGILRKYKYFTFDGGVNVNPGGVDVSGSGIAFYYSVDGVNPPHRFLRIQSISVDLVIPGSASRESAVVLIKGYLSMREATPPAGGTEYSGSVSLTLPKMKISGSASMRLNPSVPAFLIDIGLELSTPILIGSTIFGIWGFRALLGVRYVASKTQIKLQEDDPWWKYYKKKVEPDFHEGIQVSKFAQKPGFSVGAGLSIGTATDTGITFSGKVFLLLSLPDVFLLQGQGQILKGRIMLTDPTDPPFFTMIAITKNSIEAAFGVHYALPDDGDEPGGIATVDAVTEMGFFWGSSAAWYVNIGRESPDSERVQVRLLKIIDAYFYLMISGAGIRAGAGASYSLKKKFGPLKAELRAYLDTAGRISFHPSRIGASIGIGGVVEISIWGFGFSVSAAASLAAEGTKPFTITGSLKVCVRVLRKHRCAKFEFTWIFNTDLDCSEIPLLKENRQESGKALNIHTHETFDLWTGSALPAQPEEVDDYMIPLDSYIDIEFARGVCPSPGVVKAYGGNTMGSEYVDYFAPQRGKSDRVRHEYLLDKVELLYYDGGWKPYDIYAAATPKPLKPFITSDLSTLKQGFWQFQAPNRHDKLRILAQSPLTYVSQGPGDHVIEDSGITPESIFCAPDPIAPVCVDFDDYPIAELEIDRQFFHRRVQLRLTGAGGGVIGMPDGGHTRALRVDSGSSLELFLIEPAVHVRLKIRAATDSAVVRFYRRVPVPPLNTEYTYELAATRAVARGTTATEVLYDDRANAVVKIVIEAGTCRAVPPLVCDTTLTTQAHDLERFLDTLARRGQLLERTVDLCARDCGAWDGVFFNTSLYGPRVDPVYFRYGLVSSTANELSGEITDWRGFACAITLTVIDGPSTIDWKRIVRFYQIRADSDPVPGVNYTFLIDADVQVANNVVRVTLRGRSCYPITNCGVSGDWEPGVVTPEASALGDLLHRLAGNNQLVQPRVKLGAAELPHVNSMFVATRRFDEGKVWLTAAGDATKLDLTLGDRGTVSLVARDTRPDFDFNDVTAFSDLRPSIAGLKEGPNSGFVIDARLRNGDTVTLHGEAPFTVTTATRLDLGRRRPFVGWGTGASVECAVYLYEVCMLDYPSAAFNDTLITQSEVDAEVASIRNAVQGSIPPLLRPNTRYAVRLTTYDVLYRDSTSEQLKTYPNEHVFGFRTVGPLGHFHIYPKNGVPTPRSDYHEDRPDEYKLARLLHYIDFPKCYPNADGQLLNAKPLFYEKPELRLFYLQTYVARMFCDWAPYGGLEGANAVFEVLVRDPAPDPSAGDAGGVAAHWEVSPLPVVSRDVVILNNIIRHGTPCGTMTTEIVPTTLFSSFPLESVNLQPLKLYTAIFTLRFKNEKATDYVRRDLLSYGFQTSRYANFKEQVESYKKTTLFDIGKAFTAYELSVAKSVLDDSMPAGDPLRQMFGDPFNRLFDGAFMLEPLHPPPTTEFNLVRDLGSGRILGILVRNPEPFNDPKIPATIAADTIRLSVNNGDPKLYKALHLGDLSQAFVTNAGAGMSIPAGATLDFTFDYVQWDGSQYAVIESVAVKVVLP